MYCEINFADSRFSIFRCYNPILLVLKVTTWKTTQLLSSVGGEDRPQRDHTTVIQCWGRGQASKRPHNCYPVLGERTGLKETTQLLSSVGGEDRPQRDHTTVVQCWGRGPDSKRPHNCCPVLGKRTGLKETTHLLSRVGEEDRCRTLKALEGITPVGRSKHSPAQTTLECSEDALNPL